VAVEIGEPGESPLRLFVPVVLDVSEQAARADVPRGSRLSLVIREPSLEIQTGGTAMADANVGDVTTVLVTSTGRAVKARVVSAERAEVVDR
jgi:flagella basal body P-ring formation protein FlgA